MLRKAVKYFLGRHIFQPLWEKLNLISLYGMNVGGGSTVSDSGELWVMDYFRNYLSSASDSQAVVFDVGSNVGDYAREVLSRYGKRIKLF